jgi:ABC-type Fe3+ transport system permease subunit
VNQWLAAIIAGIVQAIVAILAKRSERSAEDGARRPELRDRLRERVRRKWSGKTLPVIIVLVVLLALPGCGTRTIYVQSGEPVRLRETIRSAKVWVLDQNGKPVAGVMDLPEGWYCLPVPDDVDPGAAGVSK